MNTTPLTIVVVGGVAGGASAATRARRMNEHARIILLERDAAVSFANCGMPYYVGGEIAERDKLIVASAAFLERRFGIEVRTGSLVTAIDRETRTVTVRDVRDERTCSLSYDRLVLAPGARPFKPPIAGIDCENVFTLRNLADMDAIKALLDAQAPQHAVVVGAGFIGLEMVEQLHRRGLQVDLVEAQSQVLSPLDPEMAHALQEALERKGVTLHLGQPIDGFTCEGNRVREVRLPDGRGIATDLVVLGMGVRPSSELAEAAGLELSPARAIRVNRQGQTSDPAIYAVGDAAECVSGVTGEPGLVPLAGPANRAGRIAGSNAATDGEAETGTVLGTAIVRVFDVTAGMTGLSMQAAQRRGFNASAVFVQANHHSGYFPGAQPMLLKLVYAAADGRLLGAQAVGGDGVDKRIDVVATAMHFRGTVRDLTELDLAYAPPFGSAKDPVHMAAFAAVNGLDGLTEIVQPDADLSGMQVLDVRTDGEVAAGMETGAVHIPLDDLRTRIGELDPARPTAVLCRSGLRAWVASRILRQRGFERVCVVTGGSLMREHARASGRVPPSGD